ncbi:hypothetical protein D3C81_1854720 [compost metagenome]
MRRILAWYSSLSSCARQAAKRSARREWKSGLSRSAGPLWKGWKKAPGSAVNMASQQSRPNRELSRVFST